MHAPSSLLMTEWQDVNLDGGWIVVRNIWTTRAPAIDVLRVTSDNRIIDRKLA